MSKLGNFRLPDITLSEAIKVAELIIRQYKGTISTPGLAQALNMSERGGRFLHKTAALREYGLVEGRGTLRTTPLAEQIILPNSAAEAAKAAVEAFVKVDILAELEGRLGDEIPDVGRFAILLGEITGDRIQARQKARTIRRYYADYVPYLRAAKATNAWEEDEGGKGDPAAQRVPIVQERPPATGDQIELRCGSIHLLLPRSTASIEIVESALKVIREQLREEDESALRVVVPEYLQNRVEQDRGEIERDQSIVGDRS